MSLPYDLFVTIFLESLILNLPILSDGLDEHGMDYIAREEAKVHREIVHTIFSGDTDLLQPNYGQSIMIAGHNISVGYHNKRGSNCQVWEMHEHVMTYDKEDGYSLEYIFGNYFERMPNRHR